MGPVSASQRANYAQVLSWYDNSGMYHFVAFATNQFGQPVSGVTLQANLSVSSFSIVNKRPITNPGAYPVYSGPSVVTNSSGEAEITVKVPGSNISEVNANFTVRIIVHEPNGAISSIGGQPAPYTQIDSLPNGTIVFLPVPPGEVISITSNPILSVIDSSNSQKTDVLVNWAGENGSLPTGYSLYYRFINSTVFCTATQNGNECGTQNSVPPNLTEDNMTLLGSLSSYVQVFSPPKLQANLENGSQIVFGIFFPNGRAAVSPQDNVYLISELYPSFQGFTQQTANEVVFSFMTTVYSLLVPLVAIIGSYNLYGRDRVSGVLDSVLVQPVSRRGLALSRYFSTFIGMAIAISIAMIVVDGLVIYYTKLALSSTLLLASVGAFLVELAAFIGIIMLLSRVTRSSRFLIGIGIGLFLLFDFLWSVLVLLALTFTRTGFGSSGYIGYTIALQFVNPAQFIQLVITYLTSETLSSNILISPAQYGITMPSLVVTGVLWVGIPLVGFLYLAIKRD
ncbi:MAG: ABC transporter permease [Nitrososphaerales archaeon]